MSGSYAHAPVPLDELTALVELTDLASAYGPRYHMLPGDPPAAEADAGEWLPADRLATAGSAELSRLLDAEWRGSGHRTAHAAALTLMAVYAGRVTAAAMLGWVLDGRVWDVRPPNLLVRPGSHGIAGVRLRAPRLLAAPCRDHAATVAALHEAVLNSHLLPLAAALHRATRAGLRQLHGGVAHGCATALSAAAPRPTAELAHRWAQFTTPVPRLARLGELAEVTGADGSSRLHYLRNTCCLYYTSAEAVRCASCCLTPRADRLRAYAAR
ncbi:(2Fe-2S)-binding protein [Streptomyces sp. 891-h]|uniref:(2Fe-2S)-binding protein n=1 Tax=unclassified Streptomyces TaxID=2593676 RepID=UPI001FAAF8CD|nr:(2Fe-2S)-binding protein [Streptomyces sp. 891-h]UNZ19684.1 (2Fe-2S)-binding protein [Streptomyces sp. 891-h]